MAKKLKTININGEDQAEVFKISPNRYMVKFDPTNSNIGTVEFIAKDKKELEQIINFYSNSTFATIRVDADEDHDDYDDLLDKAEETEVKGTKIEQFFKELEKAGLLKHTQYVGNAYFIETFGNDKKYIEKAYELFKQDVGKLSDGLITTIEWNYAPEWATEDEDEDDEDE